MLEDSQTGGTCGGRVADRFEVCLCSGGEWGSPSVAFATGGGADGSNTFFALGELVIGSQDSSDEKKVTTFHFPKRIDSTFSRQMRRDPYMALI